MLKKQQKLWKLDSLKLWALLTKPESLLILNSQPWTTSKV